MAEKKDEKNGAKTEETSLSQELTSDETKRDEISALEVLILQVLGQYGFLGYVNSDQVDLVLYPAGSVVNDVQTLMEGDILIIQKKLKTHCDQKLTDEDAMLEEVRVYEEKQRNQFFDRVQFFRRIKEFTRMNKQYIAICNEI